MIAHPIEVLLMNLATAGAAQRARVEAANTIGEVAGRFDVTDIPGWPLPTAALYNSLRARRAWDTVMAIGTAITKLGGHETMSENRMMTAEKDLALGGQRDEAIAALVARRGITAADATEIVERWLPRGEVYTALFVCDGCPVASYLAAQISEAPAVDALQTYLPWVYALENMEERQLAHAAYRTALQRLSKPAPPKDIAQ